MKIDSNEKKLSVLITGASTGIGRECALDLDRRGMKVFAGFRRKEDAKALQKQSSKELIPLILDITVDASIRDAVNTVARNTGNNGLYGLVNNAGIVVPGPLEILPICECKRQFDVNVFGTLAITQAFIPLLRKGKGRIIILGSILGKLALPVLGPYSASKFALNALSTSLRIELNPWNIPVSLIEAGNTSTPMWKKAETNGENFIETLSSGNQLLYSELMNGVKTYFETLKTRGISPKCVVKYVVQALISRHPKTRYIVGRDAKLLSFLVKFLPEKMRDRIIIRRFWRKQNNLRK